MLVVIGGLPGTGKSTIAREVATRTGAAWLRIDAIEQAIRATLAGNVGIAGYAAMPWPRPTCGWAGRSSPTASTRSR
jgi:hypothetical protein